MTAPGWYSDPNDHRSLRWWDGAQWTTHVMPFAPPSPAQAISGNGPTATAQQPYSSPSTVELERRLRDLQQQVAALAAERGELQAQIVETRDIIILQEVGLYEYSHPLDSAAAYKDALEALDEEMRDLIKSGESVTGTKKWAINGSEKDGAKMVADFCKLMLRAYNMEADNVVRTLKPYSLGAAVERLQKMRASISKLGASMKIEVTAKYHALRTKELELTITLPRWPRKRSASARSAPGSRRKRWRAASTSVSRVDWRRKRRTTRRL